MEHGRQAGIRCLYVGLVVSPRISHHQKTRLPKGCLDLASESPRRKATSNWSGSCGSSKHLHILLARAPERMTKTSTSKDSSRYKKLLSGPLQIYAAETITSLCGCPIWRSRLVPPKLDSCGRNQDIHFLHLQNTTDSRHCVHVPLFTMGNQKQHCMGLLLAA